MRRANIVLALVVGCAAPAEVSKPTVAPSPVSTDAAQPTAAPAAPQPPKDDAESDAAPPLPAPVEPDAPAFEPLTLSDEQLARARRVQPIVARVSAKYGVEPNFINGIIWAESKFNPRARNRSGAKGLMQLMPKTSRAMAQRIGRPNRPYDPEFAITAGVHLLHGLMEKFDGSEELALFGYARGGGSVRKWQRSGGSEMPEGVQKFIARVRRAQATFDQLGFGA